MLLKQPRSDRKLPELTVRRCPYNGNQVSFCRGLCKPIAGYGWCGRLAPHAMLSHYQVAIANYNARKALELEEAESKEPAA